MVNKIDRPNTTPTIRAICKFAVYFSVFRPFSRFSLICEGHRRYCIIRRKLESLDCAMADLKRSKLLSLVESDTSVICHVLVYSFGSFLLQDMFSNFQVFAF